MLDGWIEANSQGGLIGDLIERDTKGKSMRGKQRMTATYDIKEGGFMREWKGMHGMGQNGDSCSDHDLGPVARQKTTDE